MLAAKACNLPTKFKYYTTQQQLQSAEFTALNPRCTTPCLETVEGVIANTESVLRYLTGIKAYLGVAGQSAFDKAQVDLWMATIKSDLAESCNVRCVGAGLGAWTQKGLDYSRDVLVKRMERFEEHLALRTYFVGHSVT